MSRIAPQPITPKQRTFTSAEWRRSARGQECTVRFPGICNHDPETTILAHLRFFGVAGVGQKPSDFLAVYACSACHDALDGRSSGDVDGWDVLRGLMFTLRKHYDAGRVWR